ncbi:MULTISPECIES: DUF1840 domain-containing protein [Burkholderia]|uniref:DUF1840 domain-containing protein n=1 Tax=Burkholderia aenigmatica TaxID=2015348 RepID=A0A6J5IS45_9BURK|nr:MULTISPECIES: DUF1840 domain-containing protein [Burkholderia]MCA8024838.1 DUF1840 domain-containing protein [Burkholderia cepacia]CAB3962527.1 hypothetical protein BLA3211_01863 [Burkholderia aenigmatica]
MLIKFHTSAAPDIVMLRDLAQYLLALVGKELQARGVIQSSELPSAIARLEQAIEEDMMRENSYEHSTFALHANTFPHSSGLAQRAWPFLDLLREAHKQDKDVIWGV